jgi:uncharacterized protein with NRDE domain
MCTLILLHRCVQGSPLIAAANRDEYLDRAASGPELLFERGVPMVAPRDLRAGGTWLGLNGFGLFAAITNRPAARPDPARRSRGLLVLDALAAPSADAAAAALEGLPADRYNPFNLVVADRERAYALIYEDAPRLTALGPGAHVIGNADPDARAVPKVARLLARAEQVASGSPDHALDALGEICRGHEGQGGALDDACIHTPRYGTRSSTLLRLSDRPGGGAFRFADGPPCVTGYEDFSHLLSPLDRTIDASAGPRIARTAH